MSLTLLKGLMPHVPQMLPLLVTDPEMRSRAEETFMSPEFQENIEQYFVENIKVRPGIALQKFLCVNLYTFKCGEIKECISLPGSVHVGDTT